ncbi:MAG: acetyl-CoA carboxylase subunit alpha [Aeromicrobium sp.]|nr:acetyl-CoA carboxylase subunit alpha [Aeromicrobium sp.]
MTPELRATMGAAAVDAGKALGYVGAGTVEFLLAPDGRFFFLEVNTRLQVEHPVTELVTGLDLVRLQLVVAAGGELPPEAIMPRLEGHAIEARLYAEDAANDFLPAAGTLELFDVPLGDGVRLDSGVVSGDVVSTNYDPMLAKVIAFGATREEATFRLARALRRTRVQGVTTNRTVLIGILEHPDFVAGAIDTHFLDRVPASDLIETESPELVVAASIAAALADQARLRAAATTLPTIATGFRTNRSQLQTRAYRHGEDDLTIGYSLGRRQVFEVNGEPADVTVVTAAEGAVDLVVAGVRRRFDVTLGASTTYVSWAAGSIELQVVPRFPDPSDQVVAGSLLAPMPGTVTRVEVAEGDHVIAGQTVLVVEAMKMEHAITAAVDSVVGSIPVKVGQSVDTGQVLIILAEAEADA